MYTIYNSVLSLPIQAEKRFSRTIQYRSTGAGSLRVTKVIYTTDSYLTEAFKLNTFPTPNQPNLCACVCVCVCARARYIAHGVRVDTCTSRVCADSKTKQLSQCRLKLSDVLLGKHKGA